MSVNEMVQGLCAHLALSGDTSLHDQDRGSCIKLPAFCFVISVGLDDSESDPWFPEVDINSQ
jgi:hypothetical protein